jgi:hypothetical protein
MDIKTKNTGKTFYQVDPQWAAVLMELGMVERADKPPVIDHNPPSPKWGVTVNRGGSTCIVLTIGATTQWFDGHPDDAASGFQRKDWLGRVTGPETPEHICKLYEAQLLPSDWLRLNMLKRGKR